MVPSLTTPNMTAQVQATSKANRVLIPKVKLDKEPAITVGKPNSARHFASQNDQLMPENRILSFKPTPQLE
jgi:hypothetical protein